jgi:hypothetical protein
MVASEPLVAIASGMRFVVFHLSLTDSIVDTKGKISFANTWFSILGANISGGILTKFSRYTGTKSSEK